MSIVDTINAVHERLTRHYRITKTLEIFVAVSYAALAGTLVAYVSPLLGWCVGLGFLLAGGALAWKRGIFTPPSIQDASSLIDRKFATQDRALTLAATWNSAGEAEKALLERQLDAIVPRFDEEMAIPLAVSRGLRRALATLPVVWFITFYLNSIATSVPPAESQAALITTLLEERTDLPLSVRESLVDLKETLETKPLTDAAVIEALKAAQAQIDTAQTGAGSTTDGGEEETVEESESPAASGEGDLAAESPGEIAPIRNGPTPTPEPTATPLPRTDAPPPQSSLPPEDRAEEKTPEPQPQKEKAAEEPASEDTDVQNSQPAAQGASADQQETRSQTESGAGENQSQQQNSSGQAGKSGGDAGQEQSQGEGQEQGQESSQQGQSGDGDGDGASSAQGGQQSGKSGGQRGADGSSSQRSQPSPQGQSGKSGAGKEGDSGAKAGTSGAQPGQTTTSGKESGLAQAQETLNQIEQQLKAEQQGDQKGDQAGEKEGQAPGDQGDSPSGDPSGKSGAKPGKPDKEAPSGKGQGAGQKAGQDPAAQEGAKKDSRNEGRGQGGQNGSPPKKSPSSSTAPGDNEPREEFGDAPQLPTGSSLPQEKDAALGEGDGSGGRGSGLGDRKGFKDTEIKTGDESYDSRFTGVDGKIGLNKAPARPKTRLEDVKLAKPDPLKDPADQPIPLEYRDILE